jgi:signal peptidase II
MVKSRWPTGAAPARRQAFGRALAVLLWVLALDQISKHTIGTSIQPGQVKTLIPVVLQLVYVRNHGVAFGFLGGGGAVVYVLEGVALLALLAYLAARPARRWLWLPTGMLLGGAIGNLIDRITMGSVIDFIKLPHWPAFNVADMSITFGVIILVLVVESGRSSERGS